MAGDKLFGGGQLESLLQRYRYFDWKEPICGISIVLSALINHAAVTV
jgi:hypothetical protein